MPVGVGDILRITAVMNYRGASTVENVYYLRVSSILTATDVDVMDDVAAWLDAAYGEIVGNIPDDLTFVEIRGHNVTDDSPLPVTAWPTQTTGSGGSVGYAAGVAALVVVYTAVSRVLGRKFLPPFNEGAWNDGLLETTVIADVASFMALILADPIPAVSDLEAAYVIYRGPSGFLAPLRFVVSAIASYQRRRRPGTGI